ncbi:hypothetical protein BSFA1_70390 (plasmid) [Burkholderia sp. SFA1]|uniref:hypothetical protein n=1 Tax=unclassified Caballeronia TaxID=2646786 RepID=UPI001F1702F4|nr:MULTISPECIES: hypothetical protein [unclassified Caballeronia]MCE4546812.1 hypothetical protein [Caballeronia sp. PC1]MCE4572715.1 hypothetical protein [Caballeronia sp. CLC5]BBQ01911.1 hypothetical protein BSFA1_70390 [Burkholderia sp. SFA1]
MKKLIASLLAAAVMLPMLSYAQSDPNRASQPSGNRAYDHVYDRDYGASGEGSVQSGWTTQPSPQALGQSLYKHH